LQKLIDLLDEKVREELGDYFIVSKNRIENLLFCYKDGAKRIAELAEIIKKQQAEIERLEMLLIEQL
jgi:hypothetical protein